MLARNEEASKSGRQKPFPLSGYKVQFQELMWTETEHGFEQCHRARNRGTCDPLDKRLEHRRMAKCDAGNSGLCSAVIHRTGQGINIISGTCNRRWQSTDRTQDLDTINWVFMGKAFVLFFHHGTKFSPCIKELTVYSWKPFPAPACTFCGESTCTDSYWRLPSLSHLDGEGLSLTVLLTQGNISYCTVSSTICLFPKGTSCRRNKLTLSHHFGSFPWTLVIKRARSHWVVEWTMSEMGTAVVVMWM